MQQNNLVKLNAIFLAFSPIGRVYELFYATTLSGGLTFLLILLNFNYLINYVKIRKKEVNLILSLTLIGFFSYFVNLETFDLELFINNLYPLFIFSAGLVFSANIDIIIFKKALVILGFIATCICLFQMFQMITKGSFENFYIPGLKLFRENSDVILRLRPYSVFSEPAHLSIYLLPIFYYTLINKYYILTIFFALGILCSGSTTGLLLLVVLFIISFKMSFKNLIVYSFVAILVIFLINYFSSDILLKSLKKLEESDSNDIRLMGALDYTQYFSYGNWLLGVGFNQVDNFLLSHSIVNYSGGIKVTGNYAAAIIYVLICYGFIGEFVFLRYLKFLFIKYRKHLGFFIVFLGVLCSDQVLYNENLLYLWVILLISDSMIDEYKLFKYFC